MPNFPPQRMLVPLDLSRVSLAAWQHARELGKAFDASLDVLFVKEIFPSTEIPPAYARLDAAQKKELLSRIRSKVGPGPRIIFHEGEPAATILRVAKSRRHDLIVMGTNGRTGLKRVWMGSVTEAVVRRSPVPVWVARSKPRSIRSILAPVNFEPHSEAGLLRACELAVPLKAKVTALHVADDLTRLPNPRLRLSILTSHFPEGLARSCGLELEVLEGSPTEEILRAGMNHDLVVLVAHRRSLLGDMVLGTTAERVLRHSAVPVLAVPAPRPGREALRAPQAPPKRQWTAR